MTRIFPFAAVTGHDQAKKALLCALASNELHSVLITGDRGTGKSVLARSLGTLFPHQDVLTVPQNISSDRLLGSIDLESAIGTGTFRYTPGILEQGNGRILYADDVNLMDEGVLASLLNTAETGEILLEREGISRRSMTRFLLVATMDPAEGDLTPAEMDRFDLCVQLDSVANEDERAGIISNQFRFERDPEAFVRGYDVEEQKLEQSLRAARERLPYVSIPEGHADLISSVCLELGVPGQRGDLATARAAKALAALDGRDCVEFDDVKLAAVLALGHRRQDGYSGPPPPSSQDTPPDQTEDTQKSSRQGRDDRSEPAPGHEPGRAMILPKKRKKTVQSLCRSKSLQSGPRLRSSATLTKKQRN